MSKGVLGNDPFMRGAASRAPKEAAAPAAPPPPPISSPAPGPSAKRGAQKMISEAAERAIAERISPTSARPPVGAPAPVALPLIPSRGVPSIPLLAKAGLRLARPLAKLFTVGLGLGAALEVDDFGRDEQLDAAIAPLSDFLFQEFWRVEVVGAEHVPVGACVLVGNHAGAIPFDGAVVGEALRRSRPELRAARWLLEDQIFYAPFFGTLFNRLGAVRACPENALRLLELGHPVTVFPEGIEGLQKGYRDRYRLQRFGRGGFAKLAEKAAVPIVPIAVVGGEEAMPLLGRLPGRFGKLPYLPVAPLGPLPLPAKWVVQFGEPLRPKDGSDLAARTRGEIEALLQLALAHRGRPFAA